MSTKLLHKKQSFSDKIINQLANVSTLANYGQDINTNGFVGLVSLAAISAELWCVKGGNKLVPIRLLENNKSVHLILNATVKSISPNDEQNIIKYEINKKAYSKLYDYVIIACPLTKKNEIHINFNNQDYLNYELHFNQACIIDGILNVFPNIPQRRRIEMFSCDPSTDCRIICTQFPCDYSEEHDESIILNRENSIFKTFSPYDLTDKMVQKVFKPGYKILKKCDWFAFPKYETTNQQTYPKIHIDSIERSRVFYLNSIEWAASCMELSCISGRNVALLISNKEQGVLKTKQKCNNRGGLEVKYSKSFIIIIMITFIISIFSAFLCLKV